jgi:Tfp pilus assembly protein PilZ
VQPPPRTLTISYADAEAFREEYGSSLVHGGVFVSTDEDFELRERVRVRLGLHFCGDSADLLSEVVHVVTPEMIALGAEPGVGVQFQGLMHDVRAQLEPLARTCGLHQFKPTDPGRRAALRVKCHVPAHLECEGEDPIEGHTRDISVTGALIAVPGGGPPVGSYTSLVIENPAAGERLAVNGIVVRQVQRNGVVSALGIHFDPRGDQRAEVEDFIEVIQSAEHSRRLGGISGSIAELGPQNLLEMFGKMAPAGTLTLRSGLTEGVIGFENRLLRYARIGPASGIKALVRMLSWEDGDFEFHARLDAVDFHEAPLPMEAAMMEAVRQIDELGRIDRRAFALDARVHLGDPQTLAGLNPGKLEQAVLDLARAGFSVQRILDVIPEPDTEIYRALEALFAEGVIRLETI